jgi:two-component system LytT family response regulator
VPEARLEVLIADDEPLARQRLEDLLRHHADVDIVGEAEDGDAAVEAIRRLKPDLVFLDIQMPGRTGLDVVATIGPEHMPATVFVTAYDQHALRAFEVAAVDYLVKPFDDERFEQAFERARGRVRLAEVGRLTRQLMDALGTTAPAPAPAAPASASDGIQRFTVESRGRTVFVDAQDVDYVTAAGPYAELHVGPDVHLVRERMQDLERRLGPARFLRVHRSAIVAVDRVSALERTEGGETIARLRDGRPVPVSRARREALVDALSRRGGR